jgi:hypothetical protein
MLFLFRGGTKRGHSGAHGTNSQSWISEPMPELALECAHGLEVLWCARVAMAEARICREQTTELVSFRGGGIEARRHGKFQANDAVPGPIVSFGIAQAKVARIYLQRRILSVQHKEGGSLPGAEVTHPAMKLGCQVGDG